MRKIVKRAMLALAGLLLILITGTALFVNLSPQFGGQPTTTDMKEYSENGNYADGKFVNLIPTSMDMNFTKGMSVMWDFMRGVPNGRPDFEIPVEKIDSLTIVKNVSQTKLIWFGHSAFLLQIDGKNILLDPMLGEVPAPHPWLGSKRFNKQLPIEIEQLPQIDAILISHDHYDHLDYGSIQKLKGKTKQFYVPLGVGAHFLAWGVPAESIHEFNWWDEIQHEDLKIAFAPARHFSGRGLTNRNSTLWGSWIITGQTHNIYFSGDGGYGPHFKEIGAKYGPFDFAMLECGQYNPNWVQIHMMPEETAQAAVDVQAKLMMPIHWGAFTLALHSWTDPIERVTKKAAELNMPLIAPKIGQPIHVGLPAPLLEEWWVNPNKEML
jgi:L-ascorbate metabolism protein UlaG (beta-lactamase superfamily)